MVYLKNIKYTVELRNMKINFILTEMTLDSYNISREEVRIFPQIALPSRIKSPKTGQNYKVRYNSKSASVKNKGTLLNFESLKKIIIISPNECKCFLYILNWMTF